MAAEKGSYTAKQLSELAGVSVRTLHYYEEAGLLHPVRRANNYREYRAADVERLQHILLLKECGLKLTDIRRALDGSRDSISALLACHLDALRDRRRTLEALIGTVERTIDSLEGKITMTDEQRFEGLKASMIENNEREYGAEIRQKYGDEAVDAANAKIAAMTEAGFEEAQNLSAAINDQLRKAMATEDPTGPEARELCEMHARWLKMHWGDGMYSLDAHAGLAEGYVADARFAAYYENAAGPGAAAFLRDAIVAWCIEQA